MCDVFKLKKMHIFENKMEFRKAPRSIRIEGQNKIQTDRCMIVGHSSEYKRIEIQVSDAFVEKWRSIEERAKEFAEFEWSSSLGDDGVLRVKYDDDSMFFNQDKSIIEPDIQIGAQCILIIEFLSVYSFNKKNGLTTRVHQAMLFSPECML